MKHTVIFFVLPLLLFGCQTPDSNPTSRPFKLWVSNQSYALSPVDIQIEIDGRVVVNATFPVQTQHHFVGHDLQLTNGAHTVFVTSQQGDAELTTEFELKDQDFGVITYWYQPGTGGHLAVPKQFRFRTGEGEIAIE